MTDEKWQMLVEQAKKNFQDVSVSSEDLLAETQDGLLKQGSQDILEFTNDAGIFKIVRENRPVVLEKKQYFSHRQGDSARTEYIFSDKEFSHKARFYKQDYSGEWQELSAEDSLASMI